MDSSISRLLHEAEILANMVFVEIRDRELVAEGLQKEPIITDKDVEQTAELFLCHLKAHREALRELDRIIGEGRSPLEPPKDALDKP